MAGEWKSYHEGGKDKKNRTIDAVLSHHDSHILYEANGKLEIEGNIENLNSDGES